MQLLLQRRNASQKQSTHAHTHVMAHCCLIAHEQLVLLLCQETQDRL
jgi:hypothetical protein